MARGLLARWLGHPTPAVVACAVAHAGLLLAAAPGDGWSGGELYTRACGDPVRWTAADMPPVPAALLRLVRLLGGDSLLAVRLLPALAGFGLVCATGHLVRRFEGSRYAQALAALAVAAAPAWLSAHGTFTPDAFAPLVWMAVALVWHGQIAWRRASGWLRLGGALGLGLLVHPSLAFAAGGIVLATLLSRERRWLVGPWPWLGLATAAAIAAPQLAGHASAGWLALASASPWAPPGPGPGLSARAIATLTCLDPLTLPLWGGGLAWLLIARAATPFRALGWSAAAVAVAAVVVPSAPEALRLATPALFAAGAVAFERALVRGGWSRVRRAFPVVLAAAGLASAPLVIPLLAPERTGAIAAALPAWAAPLAVAPGGTLPPGLADRHGWPELAEAVADAWRGVPVDARPAAALVCPDPTVAAALDRFGPALGLPRPLCPRGPFADRGVGTATGAWVLVVGGSEAALAGRFDRVTPRPAFHRPFALSGGPGLPISIGVGLHEPLPAALAHWPPGR